MKKKLLERYFEHSAWMGDILHGLLKIRPTTDLDTVLGMWTEMRRRHKNPVQGGGLDVLKGGVQMGYIKITKIGDVTQISAQGNDPYTIPSWLLEEIRAALPTVEATNAKIRRFHMP